MRNPEQPLTLQEIEERLSEYINKLDEVERLSRICMVLREEANAIGNNISPHLPEEFNHTVNGILYRFRIDIDDFGIREYEKVQTLESFFPDETIDSQKKLMRPLVKQVAKLESCRGLIHEFPESSWEWAINQYLDNLCDAITADASSYEGREATQTIVTLRHLKPSALQIYYQVEIKGSAAEHLRPIEGLVVRGALLPACDDLIITHPANLRDLKINTYLDHLCYQIIENRQDPFASTRIDSLKALSIADRGAFYDRIIESSKQ